MRSAATIADPAEPPTSVGASRERTTIMALHKRTSVALDLMSPTAEETFFANEAPGHYQRLFILRLHPDVYERAVKHSGDKVVPDAFDDIALEALLVIERVWLCQEGSFGIDGDNNYTGVALLELSSNSSQCPSSSWMQKVVSTVVPSVLCVGGSRPRRTLEMTKTFH
jgi:hypothetical protein